MLQHPDLLETLRQAQRFGFFGGRPIEEAVDHSMSFVAALAGGLPAHGPRAVVDLGSGGGLPGLVVADAYRETSVVLVDRREKRTDFLQRAVSRLAFSHVTVIAGDVEAVCREVEAGKRPPFDAVTARGFGPPGMTLRCARRLMSSDGVVVISEPPSGNRWDATLLEELELTSELLGQVRVFRQLPG
jgi:16S rRNA (guanine527-N7)-methyltransferase